MVAKNSPAFVTTTPPPPASLHSSPLLAGVKSGNGARGSLQLREAELSWGRSRNETGRHRPEASTPVLRPVHCTQGVCPAQPSETSFWLKCHRLKDKQDQRRDNPYPRLHPPPPSPNLPPLRPARTRLLLREAGRVGGGGGAWGGVGMTSAAPASGRALVSSFCRPDWPRWSLFLCGKSHHSVSAPTRSAWISQNLQIITGGDNRCSCQDLMTINSLPGSLLSKCH